MHRRGSVEPGHLEKRGGHVNVLDQGVASASGVRDAGPVNDQRRAQRFFVHPTLVVPAVIAEEEALVGRIDNDRVVLEFLLAQETPDLAHTVVQCSHTPQIVFDVALIVPSRKRLALQIQLGKLRIAWAEGFVPRGSLLGSHLRQLRTGSAIENALARDGKLQVVCRKQIAGNSHLSCLSTGVLAAVVVEEVFGLGDLLIRVLVQVADRGLPGAVGC